jgi:hypothetical protein
MSASPQRPAQSVGEITGGLHEHCREQVLDLVAGQRDQPGRWWVLGVFEKGQQAGHERPGPLPQLHPSEPTCDPTHQLVE